MPLNGLPFADFTANRVCRRLGGHWRGPARIVRARRHRRRSPAIDYLEEAAQTSISRISGSTTHYRSVTPVSGSAATSSTVSSELQGVSSALSAGNLTSAKAAFAKRSPHRAANGGVGVAHPLGRHGHGVPNAVLLNVLNSSTTRRSSAGSTRRGGRV